MNFENKVPNKTPIKLAKVKAQDAAKKIVRGEREVAEKERTPN